ncbi:MAG: hypothetical protein ACFE9I_05950 [Candidatus Hermodarchaeota archaeon]
MSIEEKALQISEYYEIIIHTFEFLKDSKDWLEYKKMNKKVNEESYNIRLKSLINMALVYFYSLYEGFTREFFKKLTMNDLKITKSEFDSRYQSFHDIIEKLMKDLYKIHIPDNVFSVIMKLRIARHNIAHGEKDAKSDFDIVKICFQALFEYFQYMENNINIFSKRLTYLKFTE